MSFPKSVFHVLRWTARVIGSSILAFVLVHLVSEGLPKIGDIAPGEWLLWTGFLLSLIGFALLWKWELTGGIVALAGIALFYVMNFALSGKFPGGWVFPIFFVPGVFSIVCWLTDRRPTIH
ncbi:MAG: hypothetical protein GXP24_06190 [Planctomycetes bacterium]|nr:hypothetical protein [Planctomycetota bacterium]